MVGSRPSLPSWVTAATTSTRVDFEGNVSSMSKSVSDMNLGFGERAFSAAGAAAISAILVNPLDIAKTRLQAQAAGVPYHYQGPCPMACFDTNTMLPDLKSTTSSARALLGSGSEPVCPSDCNRYTGTLDVLYKVIRQEGFTRLWRGTNASLALAVPTVGIYLPCYDIFRNSMEEFTIQNAPNLTPYVPLVAGSVSRSLACVSCYPVELARTRMQCKTIVYCGPDLEHSLHVMFLSLQSAGQLLSRSEEEFLDWWVMKPVHPASLEQTFLLVLLQESLQLLLHVR
ncbi:hypothetical protein ACB092_11G095500 [Castanea dentata]